MTSGSGATGENDEEALFEKLLAEENTAEPLPDGDYKEVEIMESGYTIKDTYATYGVVLHNPNQDVAAKNVRIEAIVRDADGTILATHDSRIRFIAAGDTISFGNDGMIGWEQGVGASLELKIRQKPDDFVLQDGSGILYAEDLQVKDAVAQKTPGGTPIVVGEVENNSDLDLDDVCVTATYRKDGKIIGGWFTFTDALNAHDSCAFDVYPSSLLADYDTFDVMALQWTPFSLWDVAAN